jgi:hypothetical protein
MIHSLRRDRKAKAIAEVLAMIADAPRHERRIGRVPSSRRTNGYSKAPPNFSRLWKNMPSALSKLRKRTNDKASLSAGGAQDQ